MGLRIACLAEFWLLCWPKGGRSCTPPCTRHTLTVSTTALGLLRVGCGPNVDPPVDMQFHCHTASRHAPQPVSNCLMSGCHYFWCKTPARIFPLLKLQVGDAALKRQNHRVCKRGRSKESTRDAPERPPIRLKLANYKTGPPTGVRRRVGINSVSC